VTPDDRDWLDSALLHYIEWASSGKIGVSDEEIWNNFAPLTTHRKAELCTMRPGFAARKRRVQKEMVDASVRRLFACGRIKVAKTYSVRRKHQWEPAEVRLLKKVDILDALAGA
jgi:hypothetical protein